MRHLAVLLTLCATLAFSVPAEAQAPGQGSRTDIGGTQGKQAFSVRGHLIVWGAVGWDLDLIGSVTAQTAGAIRGTPTLIVETAYPDVYVSTQQRRYIGIGYGISQRVEIFARYQQANNPAAAVDIGRFATTANTFPITFENYKDRLFEGGIRKYIASPKSTREYFAIMGGMKRIDPFGMTMAVPGGDVKTAVYGASRVLSIGLELGVTVEYHRVGLFLESGFRYQGKLKRDDADLGQYGLDGVNNTGYRFFMPANIGLLVRF